MKISLKLFTNFKRPFQILNPFTIETILTGLNWETNEHHKRDPFSFLVTMVITKKGVLPGTILYQAPDIVLNLLCILPHFLSQQSF